mmetsp:Transcript_9330/g.23209  ORF Transcript_9330/g.23209 Transcript_9330/m.23209 type:complete len:822 (+) Transcript_9330:200-2665(+)|eukprot:CAMPEP_0116095194 /NCGR_PEP_ID=MMETSP0327-20121206/9534_1 /TAXON_ID=44447 /ORGANISM="Pseudo-nitzschia delicatissima, Strain B596" /LENGTH=821 /DNA_ID=CAMNT_0003586847 /DNA_START=148 /DNA_END=2613 /DNA_ORIENTATION=-
MSGISRRIRSNSNKRPRTVTKLRNEEEEQTPPDTVMKDKSTPPMETPRVLTKSSVNSLTHGLDASDVLEVYALVRSAPLHGIANSSITVQKMTIGIRFRPKAADLKNPFNVKTPMELTLEYGPARLGPLLSDEAMPIVQGNDESSSYLAWDNAAKVYYTQKIVTESYLSSHYMASMTGAVLNKLLTEAVEYTKYRKVYQPFAIYSDTDKLLLRSSSSADFSWFVWSHLAKLGVEIEPILPPAMYDARLYTKTVTKVFPDQSVVREAATFYQRLYNCMESIATNNYGSFLSSKQQAAIGDDDEILADGADDGDNRYLGIESDHLEEEQKRSHHLSRKGRKLEGGVHEIEDDDEESEVDETEDPEDSEEKVPDLYDTEVIDNLEEETNEKEQEQIVKNSTAHDESTTVAGNDEEPSNVSETVDALITDSPSDEPTSVGNETLSPTEAIHDVEKAQNAANDAQKAADEAKNAAQTEGETKAADAAQAAADAALAAADATSSAASQAAMDSILSGDGSMMSSIVSTCFSNPRYEISSPDTNRTVPVGIYLFRDPSTYYKLELISPYLEVTKLNRPLPKAASMLSDYGAGGDALDWSLAIGIVLSMFLMVLLICQQMGKRYVGSIFKCQRWLFNSRNHDDEMEQTSGVQSGSHFFFGKSGIPVSMGGKKSSYSPLKNGETLQNMMVDESFTDEDGDGAEHGLDSLSPQGGRRKFLRKRSPSLELEMVNFGSDSHNQNRLQTPTMRPYKDNSDSSHGSSESDEIRLETPVEIPVEVPDRLLRNPDLVEMPSLKSKSKVAIPVGRPVNGSGAYSNSSSFAESSVHSTN